jgi:hypothetical protein
MRTIPLAIVCCLFSSAAQAEMDATKLLQTYDKATPVEQNIIAQNLNLVEMGMAYANAELTNHNRSLIYCTPAHLSLTGQQLVNILKNQLEETPAVGSLPFGAVMIAALKRVFPCGK